LRDVRQQHADREHQPGERAMAERHRGHGLIAVQREHHRLVERSPVRRGRERHAERVGEPASEVDEVDRPTRLRGDARPEDTALDVPQFVLGAAMATAGQMAVIGEQEPARIRRLLEEAIEHRIHHPCCDPVQRRVATGPVSRGIDAQDVHEHELRIARDRGARMAQPLAAPCLGRGVLRDVERICGGLGVCEAERAHDPSVVLRDRDAARDLRRNPDEWWHERRLGAKHVAALLLREPAPQRALDRQRHGGKADVDHEVQPARARGMKVHLLGRDRRREPVDQDDAHAIRAREGRMAGRRQPERIARRCIVVEHVLDPAMARERC